MKSEWIRWLASVVFFAFVIAKTIDNRIGGYQIMLGVGLCAALVYEHGYKLDFKFGRRGVFYVFYLVPFCVEVIAVLSVVLFNG